MDKTILKKANLIRLFILDVDGILTNGVIHYHDDGTQLKSFHIQDGLGIRLLQKVNIPVAIISSKQSRAVLHRLTELNVMDIYQGYEKKIPAYQAIKEKYQLNDGDIAYMGDDLPDIPVLRQVGFAITVPHAPLEVKQATDFITQKNGGQGAVREVCDMILQAKGLYDDVLSFF